MEMLYKHFWQQVYSNKIAKQFCQMLLANSPQIHEAYHVFYGEVICKFPSDSIPDEYDDLLAFYYIRRGDYSDREIEILTRRLVRRRQIL